MLSRQHVRWCCLQCDAVDSRMLVMLRGGRAEVQNDNMHAKMDLAGGKSKHVTAYVGRLSVEQQYG